MRQFLIVSALLASPAAAQTQVVITPSPDLPVVTVLASESIDSTPDIATIGVGVSTLAPTATAALAQNSTKMTRVVTAIRAQGVADRDVQTRGISVNPEYNYVANQQRFIGYRVSNTVTVIFRDVSRIGPFLDAMIAAGGNTIDGPNFAVDKPEGLQATARDRALAKAETEASAYARRTGHRRARLLSITESGAFSVPSDIMVTAQRRGLEVANASAPPPPVAPGRLAVGINLTAVYRLED